MTVPAIDISPAERTEIQAVTLSLPDSARAIKVLDYATREDANAFFLKCREARKVIAAHYDPKIDEWKAAKKLADENRAKMVAEKDAAESPIREAEAIVNREILRFDTEERARIDKERREAEEKARKEAEERALAEAAAAEASGDKEEAAAIIQEAIAAPVFVPAPPPSPKLAGSTEVVNWKYEVTDLEALIMAVAAGKAPVTYLQPNLGPIRSAVTDQKKYFSCPGIKAWPGTSRKATGR